MKIQALVHNQTSRYVVISKWPRLVHGVWVVRRVALVVGCLLILSRLCEAQQAAIPIKVAVITDETDRTSTEVSKLFRQKLSGYPKFFALTTPGEATLLSMVNCVPRSTNEAYACYYVAHYVGVSAKTLMGGGIYLSKTADDAADNIIAATLLDVGERWNNTVRSNAIEALETCLFMTQSSCAVPESLAAELKTKIINLSQYLQKGGLKK